LAEDPNANEVDNPLGRLTIDDREDNAYLATNSRLTWNINENLKFSAFGSYTYNAKENLNYIPTNIKAGIREGRGKSLSRTQQKQYSYGKFEPELQKDC